MFVESTNAAPGAEFLLYSGTLLAPPGPYLVTFWYHAMGEHVGELSVWLDNGQAELQGPVWTIPEGEEASLGEEQISDNADTAVIDKEGVLVPSC